MNRQKSVESQKAAQQKILTAYNNCFSSESGKIVLEDLKNLCSYNSSTWRGEVNQMMIDEGQRKVLLRIINYSDPRFLDKQSKLQKGDSK